MPDDDIQFLLDETENEDFVVVEASDGGLELQTSHAILYIRPDHTWSLIRF